MRFFSDEMREWAEYTYEVFVPEAVREKVYDLTHNVDFSEKQGLGEFQLVSRKFSSVLEQAVFVPDVEPLRSYEVPFEALKAAMEAESAEEAESIIIAAGGYGVLMEEE